MRLESRCTVFVHNIRAWMQLSRSMDVHVIKLLFYKLLLENRISIFFMLFCIFSLLSLFTYFYVIQSFFIPMTANHFVNWCQRHLGQMLFCFLLPPPHIYSQNSLTKIARTYGVMRFLALPASYCRSLRLELKCFQTPPQFNHARASFFRRRQSGPFHFS